jgi:hypothetical protein
LKKIFAYIKKGVISVIEPPDIVFEGDYGMIDVIIP